eukprot:COSAG03_NODE_22768_length_287_cov_0.739362_1_plen_21_part_01
MARDSAKQQQIRSQRPADGAF